MINHRDIPIIEPQPGGYYAIYPDHKIWHDELSPNMKWKSKEQLNEENQFALLPNDDYKLRIAELKEITRDKYKAQPDENGVIPQEDVVNYTLEIVSFKDGSDAKDDDGKFALGKKIFFTFNPNAMGFAENGTVPSKSRCFVAYSTEQNPNNELELKTYQELIGKTIYAEIIQYTTQAGKNRNKINRLLPPPRVRDDGENKPPKKL